MSGAETAAAAGLDTGATGGGGPGAGGAVGAAGPPPLPALNFLATSTGFPPLIII